MTVTRQQPALHSKLLLLVAFALLCCCAPSYNAWSVDTWSKMLRKRVPAVVLASCIALQPNLVHAETQSAPSVLSFKTQLDDLQRSKGIVTPAGETPSFADQINSLKNERQGMQKEMKERDENAMSTRQLAYPEGKLVARGVISLDTKPEYPYGLYEASELDPAFAGPDATLFILGVGRDGPPLAAQRLKLKDIKFPYTFEITCDDLLFPYSSDSWQNSDARKDTIATTALMSSNARISTPSNNERYGFGSSDPVMFAGSTTRSLSRMNVQGKVDGSMYTPDDLKLLGNIDNLIDNKDAAKLKKK